MTPGGRGLSQCDGGVYYLDGVFQELLLQLKLFNSLLFLVLLLPLFLLLLLLLLHLPFLLFFCGGAPGGQ